MIQASVHGRIGTAPVTSTTAKGNDMTRVSIAVDCSGHNAESEETLWISILAFGKVAESLARASKGESLTAQGKLTKGRFVGKDGQERESWTLVADAVLTLRSARPGQARKPADRAPRAPAAQWERDGDPIAF